MTMNMKHKENMEKLHARLLTLKANEAMVITLAWLQQFERMADTHTTNIRGCKYSPAIYIHTPRHTYTHTCAVQKLPWKRIVFLIV